MTFTFKNKEDYLEQRNTLLNEANSLINEGKTNEANEKMKAVEEIDTAFANHSKAIANFNALSKEQNEKAINFKGDEKMNNEKLTSSQLYNSDDYRNAFMKNVLTGEKMPTVFENASQNTKTSDAGAVIPTTIMQRIIEKIEEHGQILAEVTQTSYKGGLSVPTSSVKPTATWVSEGTASDTQKKSLGTVTFSYYKLRCAVSMTLEVETTTLDFFEKIFVAQVSEAIVKALETAIINGTGTAQPKGILKETVVTGQNVDIAKTGSISYKTLWDMLKKVPSGYRSAVKWCMNYATFCDIMALTDTAGQPIARINYGLHGGEEATLLGRKVVFSDDVTAYADAPSSDSVVAFLFNFSDYILNTNLQMTIKQYEDNETDNKVTKAVMIADGKVVDVNSLVTLTKKSA